MIDKKIIEYLDLAKKITKKTLKKMDSFDKNKINYFNSSKNYKEIKSNIDFSNNKFITKALNKTKLQILSEEKIPTNLINKDYYWVLDPLDGTVNYINNIKSSSVSLALFKGEKPIFGVIGEYPSMRIYWGGKQFSSFLETKKIKVSNRKNIKDAILFTGFPANFIMNKKNFQKFSILLKKCFKVRMIGSASLSLINIAQGSGDIYYEKNIMFWDIAAGIAILEGAGGKYNLRKINRNYQMELYATNKSIKYNLK